MDIPFTIDGTHTLADVTIANLICADFILQIVFS
jgi:hypothetical protein